MTACTEQHTRTLTTKAEREGQKGIAKVAEQ